MRSPAKENRAVGSAIKKRQALGGLDGSPAKKQQKKPSKKDRRRVSFAPDPELTLVHHFVKDDDYTSNSDGPRVIVNYEEPVQQRPPDAQHPALVADGGSSYQPGFWNKTVPENSPLTDPLPMDSPGMVSMEITQPTMQHHGQQQQQVPGEVTAGLPSLGALAEADEWEEGQAGMQQQQQQAVAPGEVTAGLPSLGALAEADELEEQQEAQQQQQPMGRQPSEVTAALPSLGALAEADEWEEGQQQAAAAAGWADVAAGNVTGNITAALPGLGALVEEDENVTAGMDLTMPTGRVLEHNQQQLQQPELAPSPAPTAAVAAPSPAPTAAAPSPSPAPTMAIAPSPAASQPQHPALAATEEVAGAAELEPTAQVAVGRRSSGTDELVKQEAVKAQLNKWGFAPGTEDTLDINLELHGRMIMGDQTFNRMYCDNTTGDSRYERPAADDTGDSLLLEDEHAGHAVLHGAAAPSPAVSQGSQHRQARQPTQSPAPRPSPAAAAHQQARDPAAQAPNWTAPAFLPPYMQGPANSSAPSDHPALVHSPAATNSSLNTLETRRISVDNRRHSINSRRFSMQDATGRLLADDDDDLGAGLPLDAGLHPAVHVPAAAAEAPASAGHPARRRSSAAFGGRDVTEKLLVDDSIDEDDVGPLADLKRQMRMLSQGSPVLAPLPEQAAAVQEVAAEQDLLAATAAEAAAPAPSPAGAAAMQQLVAAKTPRATMSLGYADSHNPATAALLRTGGTTRLLQETVNLQAHQEEDWEEQPAAAAAAAAAAAGEELPDGGITMRTNGTTKLLADMTMASVVGVKLLGRAQQGTPELGRAPSNDGLTDFSLDEFERPPELPSGQQAAAASGAAAGASNDEEMLEPEEQQQQQQQPVVDEYASPAVPQAGEFGTGYPVAAEASAGMVIPGGPKLARTPVPVRAASQPRSVQGTPHSNARSMRSQQQQHQATPGTHGTHGTHRLARTPGSARPPMAAYPADVDATADMIPGGPKLARTPLGRTPATGGFLPAPGSAVAQHHPGSGRMVQFAVAPGSASMGRYPGSAVAMHRGGMTPQFAPPPMTFQDFAKLTEVQFLDNLRRGASINYADLQPNPVPQNLAEAYRLLTIISPQVTTLENGIRILQEEVQSRRVSAADAEQLVGQVNPAAFQRAQQVDDEGLEVLREHVGQLKKVCRQKAVYCLKDVRRQMEESRGARLRRNLEALQGDLAFAQGNKEQMEAVAKAAEQYIAEQHQRMGQEQQARQDDAARCTVVEGMRRAISEEAAANEQRRQRLQEVQERVAKLREEHAVLHREREALRGRTDALQVTLMQSQGQEVMGRDSSPQAILQKLEELDVLKSCVGWQLEGASEDPVSGEVALRLADLFRLRLHISRAGAAASVEMVADDDCKVPASQRAVLAALAGCPDGAPSAEVRVADASAAKVAALVLATSARLSRVADLADELDGLRLACPALSDVCCNADGSLVLSFVNLDSEVKFAVNLRLPESYPMGPVQQEAKIWFDGDGQITQQRIAHAVAGAAEVPGRLRAICRELSLLAREVAPRPALSQGHGFHSNWQNPLFGGTPAVSAQS